MPASNQKLQARSYCETVNHCHSSGQLDTESSDKHWLAVSSEQIIFDERQLKNFGLCQVTNTLRV